MERPTDAQLALLEGFERRAFGIADTVNRRPALKRASQAFLRTVGAGWVYHFTKHIMHKHGLEHLTSLRPDRGVIVIANHRSFFDLYTVACVVLRNTTWVRRMYFPVRGDFFYERPAGVAVNAVMSAMAMYPPVLRQPHKRPFNQYAVDFLADELARPGVLVGFHPEGTRNKTDDPYALLPANPGVGQIVHQARPIVLPVFVLGLGNDLPRQIAGNFTGKGEPITVVFGRPLDLEAFHAEPARLRTYKRLADHLAAELVALGAVEREIREREGMPSKAPASVSASPGSRPRAPGCSR
jgi:1-acyl-sn-glycerol-3-phosphate acyltransferase